MESAKSSRVKLVVSGIIPLVLLGIMIFYLFGPGSELLNFGIPLPQITLEKIEFVDSEIHVTVRNTGPIEVSIAQADVNDRVQPAAIEPDRHLARFEAAKVRIPYSWNEAEPYEIGLTVHDGTRFSSSVTAAAPAMKPSLELVSYFAIIGTYVGIIPVLIGLLWFPFIAKMSRAKYTFFLAITVGLLIFLGIDAIEEGVEISAQRLAGAFNGQLLIATVTICSFVALYYISERLVSRVSAASKSVAIALMVAIGIGLHNLGEGLAIGAAIGLGEVALSTFLIVGFTIHNTTEGLAIAAPMARQKPMIAKLAAMGLIAGAPAIFGAWIGGFEYSPVASIIFLSVGAGAIFQVVAVILNWIRRDGSLLSAPIVAGIAIGMIIMYITSIII
ncbi:ZIP family metal transporter [Candidatus Nitrosotenuis uzonensis]|uniref:Putative metal cation transporter n=1 Tax=Candidatus Nitrosotenuis uzonensis TaxID=1407055 RepID=A0A812F3C3_9ARCH|nr:divalent cation transporter [Candidatus Nitrosotenuis uzonensis]CAE6493966.1 putative metal cation transporter [Candidatus Nitrosotenuis uzonensis]